MTWKIIGSSAPGTLHQKKGINCQDAFAVRILPNGYLIIAVADGAGSAPNASQGAELAVSSTAGLLYRCLVDITSPNKIMIGDAIRAAFTGTHQALRSFAEKNNQSVASFATTLACAVVTDELLGIGHLGDAVLVVKTRNGRLKMISQPQRGEYANDSYFITMPNALSYYKCNVLSIGVKGIALITDGLLRLAVKLPQYEPYPEFFRPLFTFIERTDDQTGAEHELHNFLISDPVNNRTDDDKTLVLAIRDSKTKQGSAALRPAKGR